ncbi:MAG: hypothetical protein H0U23_12465 [Blastocatellia bacterium]|nr:hypothetical protein [Blastocatellia bacterium]
MRHLLAYTGPVAVCVAAAAAGLWLICSLFPSTGISLLVPGDSEFTIAEPGRYTLWTQVEASFRGKLMTFPTGLPSGVTIAVTTRDGSVVPLNSQWPGPQRDSRGAIQVAVGSITFDSPGRYRIGTDGLQEQRALYLDRSDMRYFFVKVLLAMLIPVVFLAGVVWAVFILVRRRRKPA